MRRFAALSLLCAWIAAPTDARAAAERPEVWFAPLQPARTRDAPTRGAADYFELFEPDTAWQATSAATRVFKIYPELVRDASDEELRRVVQGVAARRMRLALETPILTGTPSCDAPRSKQEPWMVGLVRRLRAIGADLAYVALSGPLVDGHTNAQLYGCRKPIAEVAEAAAVATRLIREIYPDVVVGEIEPVGRKEGYPDWSELPQWLDAYARASGRPIAFFHLDVSWHLPWTDDVTRIARSLRAAHVPFGVIYNGDGFELSDAQVAKNTEAHYEALEALPSGRPDQAIFQSWQDYPRHVLPETNPDTMTGTLRAYLRSPTRLSLPSPSVVHLSDAEGRPVAGAELLLDVHDPSPGFTLVPQTIAGIVPRDAVSARFALRAHAECSCPARASNLLLAGFQFRQPPAPAAGAGTEYAWNLDTWTRSWRGVLSEEKLGPVPALRVNAGPNQALILNGPVFPVRPDDGFEADFVWQVERETEDTGAANLIFMNANGREIHRLPHPFLTTWRLVGRVVTDAGGDAPLNQAATDTKIGSIRVRFSGDARFRPALYVLP